ncbi:MAG: CGNR zinc finger domain-containing protein [Acidimicrobiales bacterium]
MPTSDNCLEFVNTVGAHASQHPFELLVDFDTLITWCQSHDVVSATQAELLIERARRQPVSAERALSRVKELRETTFRILMAFTADTAPSRSDIATLNTQLVDAVNHLRITASASGFSFTWRGTPHALEQMLWPLTCGIANLLTSPDLQRLRRCEEKTCGWFFIDRSRGGTRRWCSMESCGNRSKARRHYARQKSHSS